MFHFGLEIFSSPIMEMYYSNCKRNVGAGMSTLISISDELSLSIFRQKVERTRPMRKEMDGQVFLFPARVGIPNCDVI